MIRMAFPSAAEDRALKLETEAKSIPGGCRDTGDAMTDLSGLSASYLGRIARRTLREATSRVLINLGFLPVCLDLETGEIHAAELNTRVDVKKYRKLTAKILSTSQPIGQIDLGRFKDGS